MNNPIDLSAYTNRTVDFMINGKLVKVQEMTHRMYKEVIAYENGEEASLDTQRALVIKMLNNNSSGLKFCDKDIEDLPQGAVLRIYTELIKLPRKALNDPN
ncbi:MAG: hypothetical protein RR945_02770 [Erysipelotrichaceae bacterium]